MVWVIRVWCSGSRRLLALRRWRLLALSLWWLLMGRLLSGLGCLSFVRAGRVWLAGSGLLIVGRLGVGWLLVLARGRRLRLKLGRSMVRLFLVAFNGLEGRCSRLCWLRCIRGGILLVYWLICCRLWVRIISGLILRIFMLLFCRILWMLALLWRSCLFLFGLSMVDGLLLWPRMDCPQLCSLTWRSLGWWGPNRRVTGR